MTEKSTRKRLAPADQTGPERVSLWCLRIVTILVLLMIFFPPFNPGRISSQISGNLTLLTSATSYSTVTTKLSAYMTSGNRFALRASDMAQSMAGCAMIGQSVINVKSGGRGRLSTLTAGIVLLILVVFLGPWVKQIPMAALVAVMIMVSIGTFSWESVRNLRSQGLGIIITDHNVRETLNVVDRAYLVYDGRLLCEGTSDYLVNDEDARRLYLGEDFRM